MLTPYARGTWAQVSPRTGLRHCDSGGRDQDLGGQRAPSPPSKPQGGPLDPDAWVYIPAPLPAVPCRRWAAPCLSFPVRKLGIILAPLLPGP